MHTYTHTHGENKTETHKTHIQAHPHPHHTCSKILGCEEDVHELAFDEHCHNLLSFGESPGKVHTSIEQTVVTWLGQVELAVSNYWSFIFNETRQYSSPRQTKITRVSSLPREQRCYCTPSSSTSCCCYTALLL